MCHLHLRRASKDLLANLGEGYNQLNKKKGTFKKLGIIQEMSSFQKAQIGVHNLENQTSLLAFNVHRKGINFFVIEFYWSMMGMKQLTMNSNF